MRLVTPLPQSVVLHGGIGVLADGAEDGWLEARSPFDQREEPMKGVAVVAHLRPGAAEEAARLIELGPPFELSQSGLQRHTVFLAADTAVFVFEGDEPRALLAALAGAGEAPALGAWECLLDRTPTIAREVYSWTSHPAREERTP